MYKVFRAIGAPLPISQPPTGTYFFNGAPKEKFI
jgi:hypothetical protein